MNGRQVRNAKGTRGVGSVGIYPGCFVVISDILYRASIFIVHPSAFFISFRMYVRNNYTGTTTSGVHYEQVYASPLTHVVSQFMRSYIVIGLCRILIPT